MLAACAAGRAPRGRSGGGGGLRARGARRRRDRRRPDADRKGRGRPAGFRHRVASPARDDDRAGRRARQIRWRQRARRWSRHGHVRAGRLGEPDDAPHDLAGPVRRARPRHRVRATGHGRLPRPGRPAGRPARQPLVYHPDRRARDARSPRLRPGRPRPAWWLPATTPSRSILQTRSRWLPAAAFPTALDHHQAAVLFVPRLPPARRPLRRRPHRSVRPGGQDLRVQPGPRLPLITTQERSPDIAACGRACAAAVGVSLPV
jgi:hypothetical protein